jgi:hypothetical protein
MAGSVGGTVGSLVTSPSSRHMLVLPTPSLSNHHSQPGMVAYPVILATQEVENGMIMGVQAFGA